MSDESGPSPGVTWPEAWADAIHLAQVWQGTAETWKGRAETAEADVRTLRARFRLCDGCDATLARCADVMADPGKVKCCPDCRHRSPVDEDES